MISLTAHPKKPLFKHTLIVHFKYKLVSTLFLYLKKYNIKCYQEESITYMSVYSYIYWTVQIITFVIIFISHILPYMEDYRSFHPGLSMG